MADPQNLAMKVACGVFDKELNLRKAFSRYDADGNGTIDKDEFAEVMMGCLGQIPSGDALDAVFNLFDKDGNGRLSTQEFTDSLLDFGGGAPPPPSSRMRDDMGLGLGATAPTSRGGRVPSPRAAPHAQALALAKEYEEEFATGDTLTDAEVMDELSNRLEGEGVPLHTLFRVLCPGNNGSGNIGSGGSGSNRLNLDTGGLMSEAGLRDLICKMGLGGTLATPAEEAAAAQAGFRGQKQVLARSVSAGEGKFKPSAPDGTMNLSSTAPTPDVNTLGDGVADSVGRTMAYNESEQKAAQVLLTGDSSDAAVRALLPLIQAKMYEHGFDTGSVRQIFLKIDSDRSGMISPKEFFERMSGWGVSLTPEQTLHLLEPFDVDLNGEIDYNEFAKWVAMWSPAEGEAEDGQWFRGGSVDQRVWSASGSGTGKVGRLHRLMQMIDVDHNGAVESWEFIKALAKGNDFDRPVVDGGRNAGLGGGRLNADGTLKDQYREGGGRGKAVQSGGADDDAKMASLLARLAQKLAEGDANVNGTFSYMLDKEGGKNGAVGASGLEQVLGYIDVDPDGVAALVAKHGEIGVGSNVKELPIWKLMQLLEGAGGVGGAPAPEAKPIPQLEEKLPQVVRKKELTDEEKQQAALRAEHARQQAELQRQREAAKQEENDLKDAAAADRLNPQVAQMSADDLRRTQMNDNKMVKQLRAELFERSAKMKDMFRRMDVNDTGTISLIEFRKGLQRAGFTDGAGFHKSGLDRDALAVSVPDTVRLFNYFDEDGDGELSYNEFMRLLQDSLTVDYNKFIVGENTKMTISS